MELLFVALILLATGYLIWNMPMGDTFWRSVEQICRWIERQKCLARKKAILKAVRKAGVDGVPIHEIQARFDNAPVGLTLFGWKVYPNEPKG
jgi:hypothetical protein